MRWLLFCSDLLILVVGVGLGVCYRELRITRRGLGALDEGLRRELRLRDDGRERRLTALAARLSVGGITLLPRANAEEGADDGETRLIAQPPQAPPSSSDPDGEATIANNSGKASLVDERGAQ
jgi:hypothetical protein